MKFNNQSGQALLIMVMVLAAVMTIIITASYRTVVQTQATREQEEVVRVLSAADSGIEKGLQITGTPLQPIPFPTLGLGSTTLQGIDVNSSTVTISGNVSNQFVSPLVPKDQQYTFYLAEYNNNGTFGTSYTGSQLSVYYGLDDNNNSINCDTLAVELTLVSGDGTYTVRRYVGDVGNQLNSQGDADQLGQSVNEMLRGNDGQNDLYFACKAVITTLPTNTKLLFVRSLFKSTKLGFKTTAGNLPTQGRYVQSEARSFTGITKTVRVFQSYPQLPSDFFVTSF